MARIVRHIDEGVREVYKEWWQRPLTPHMGSHFSEPLSSHFSTANRKTRFSTQIPHWLSECPRSMPRAPPTGLPPLVNCNDLLPNMKTQRSSHVC
ncbi:hypothetical protein TNCV_2824221 [Trichonephila clavipes]|nr:hypothetical protein TNCV_2824221 [Trichonephila clavipes]